MVVANGTRWQASGLISWSRRPLCIRRVAASPDPPRQPQLGRSGRFLREADLCEDDREEQVGRDQSGGNDKSAHDD